MKRLLYYVTHLDTPSDLLERTDSRNERYVVDEEALANVISSETDVAGVHMPVIDLDHGLLDAVLNLIEDELGTTARLSTTFVPSKTEGHCHAYVDAAVSWTDFEMLLDQLEKWQLINPGYWAVSKARGATFVRLPLTASELDAALRDLLVENPPSVAY